MIWCISAKHNMFTHCQNIRHNSATKETPKECITFLYLISHNLAMCENMMFCGDTPNPPE